MNSNTGANIVVTVLIAGILLGITYGVGFAYPELTKHTLQVEIKEEFVVPTGNSGDGSAYMFNVENSDRKVIELQRAWYMWGDNIDELYFDTKKLKDKTVEFECFGWYIPSWYWYDQCYKIKQVIAE